MNKLPKGWRLAMDGEWCPKDETICGCLDGTFTKGAGGYFVGALQIGKRYIRATPRRKVREHTATNPPERNLMIYRNHQGCYRVVRVGSTEASNFAAHPSWKLARVFTPMVEIEKLLNAPNKSQAVRRLIGG